MNIFDKHKTKSLMSDKKKLLDAIKIAITLTVAEWNNTKKNQFENLMEQSFSVYFSNRQTQEKTKMVSPIIDAVFSRIMKKLLINFHVDEGKGKDYRWCKLELENKLTLSVGNSWTGNGYKKTSFHILNRMELNDDGEIISYFSALVDLSECESNWTAPTTKSNFSTLKFLNNDFSKIQLIHGDMTKKQKFINFVNTKVNL